MKLLKKLSLLVLGFTLFIACNTPKNLSNNNSTIVTKSKYTSLDNALVWKIESVKTKTSYLFGTIHMIDVDEFFLPSGLEDAIANVDKMVFEIDMNEMNSLGMQLGMMDKLIMKDGLKLSDLLSEDQYTIVSDFFSAKGLPMFFLESIKPLFLSAMTEVDMSGGGDAMKSYEMELFEMAKEENKTVGGLETIEYQLEIFDKIPYKAQAEMLYEGVMSNKESSGEMDELIRYYKEQNIEALGQSIDDNDEMSDYMSILLHDRNANWIPQMEAMMTSEPVLFAVGAGHLAGRKGVINLLRIAGYKVSPISNKQMK